MIDTKKNWSRFAPRSIQQAGDRPKVSPYDVMIHRQSFGITFKVVETWTVKSGLTTWSHSIAHDFQDLAPAEGYIVRRLDHHKATGGQEIKERMAGSHVKGRAVCTFSIVYVYEN